MFYPLVAPRPVEAFNRMAQQAKLRFDSNTHEATYEPRKMTTYTYTLSDKLLKATAENVESLKRRIAEDERKRGVLLAMLNRPELSIPFLPSALTEVERAVLQEAADHYGKEHAHWTRVLKTYET